MARSKPPRKDQSVDPPWEYDGSHFSIVGRKRSTGGYVTVLRLEWRDAEVGPLYHPLRSQAHELGRELAALLNEHGVWLPDPRITGPVFSGESAPESDQHTGEAQ